jgi:hypothetical protein
VRWRGDVAGGAESWCVVDEGPFGGECDDDNVPSQ